MDEMRLTDPVAALAEENLLQFENRREETEGDRREGAEGDRGEGGSGYGASADDEDFHQKVKNR